MSFPPLATPSSPVVLTTWRPGPSNPELPAFRLVAQKPYLLPPSSPASPTKNQRYPLVLPTPRPASMLPNSSRVRWLSASRSQFSEARGFIRAHPSSPAAATGSPGCRQPRSAITALRSIETDGNSFEPLHRGRNFAGASWRSYKLQDLILRVGREDLERTFQENFMEHKNGGPLSRKYCRGSRPAFSHYQFERYSAASPKSRNIGCSR